MTDNNDKLIEMTQQTALKSITVPTLGASILQPGYRNQFIIEATRNQSILNDARRVLMMSHIENIDRTGFTTRVMEPATENVAPTGTDPSFAQEKLMADEYIAMTGITDKSLRRNIQKGGFGSTLVSMLSTKFGEDWESLCVFGDTSKYTAGSLLKSKDGWVKKCTNKLYGKGTGKDFDGTANITTMLQTMIKTYPKNYLKNRGNLRFYLNSDQFDAYIDEVGLRPTIAGDEAVSKFVARPYKGIPVMEAPVLNDSEGIDTTNGYGQTALLQDPNNMIYGIFYQITMESDRIPKQRRTDYIMTTEVDQGFENPNVGVVAFSEGTKA